MSVMAEGATRTRGDVAAAQRTRMLRAMCAAVAAKGYVNVAVADVIAGARVSRATFYEMFADKADCMLATLDAYTRDGLARVEAAIDRRAAPRQQLRAVLDRYLAELVAAPDAARVCLVEVYAVGPDAVRLRVESQARYVRLFRRIHRAFERAGEPVRPMSPFDFEAMVAAVSGLVTNRVAAGETSMLTKLRPNLERLVLTTFGLLDR